MTYFQVLSPT